MSKVKKLCLVAGLIVVAMTHEMTFKEEQSKGRDYANTNYPYPAYHVNAEK